MIYPYGIRSLTTLSKPRWPHRIISALPPHDIYHRLALKLFRGEPAITVFD